MNEILALLAARCWALEHDTLQALMAWADAGGKPMAAKPGRPATAKGGAIAVIPIFGPIDHHGDWISEVLGWATVDGIRASFRSAMADPAVGAIVLHIDSPGGVVDGVPELAAEILAARGQGKPIIALANTMAASAAYWIASAAQEIVVAPSGSVGSIGVYAMHLDYSKALELRGIKATVVKAGKYKAEGIDVEPLSGDALAAVQDKIDTYYTMFVDAVAAGRGVKSAAVREGFGEGRTVLAAKAKALGMVDRVDTLDGVLARLGGASTGASAAKAEDPAPAVVAEEPAVAAIPAEANPWRARLALQGRG